MNATANGLSNVFPGGSAMVSIVGISPVRSRFAMKTARSSAGSARTLISRSKSRRASLAHLNSTLEQQVEERTAELMAAEETLRQSQKPAHRRHRSRLQQPSRRDQRQSGVARDAREGW